MNSVGLRTAVVVALTAVLAAGCTSGDDAPGRTGERTVTTTETRTSTAPPGKFVPPEPSTVKALPPGRKPPANERSGRCPYIRTGLDIDPTGKDNVADIEGNRIARNTILTDYKPVGCRFYFIGPPYNATADIRPYTLPSATQAFNAMVLTARTGSDEYTAKNFVPGITGIGFRTKFGGEHGARDWAFAFATGRTMVVVHTERADTSRNALYLARAIATKF